MNDVTRKMLNGRRRKTLVACLTLASCIACGSMTYAPSAPKDPNAMGPQGESEPAVMAPENSLDSPAVVEVVCSPQGTPLVETEEVRRCQDEDDCQIVCKRTSLTGG